MVSSREVDTGAVIMVTRNNLALTKKAIKSVREQDFPVTLLVIDNASTDGTQQWLKTKDVATICYTTQRSLSACWNEGIKCLWRGGHTRCLVLNNDITLDPRTYWLLAEREEPFITCVSVDNPAQMPDALPIHGSMFDFRPHPDFSCFMISKSVTDKIGWFDESFYPAYAEDCDMHVRMHRAGIKAGCIDLPFLHLGAQTVKNASAGEAEKIKRGAEENRHRFFKKYGCYPGTEEYGKLFL